PPEHVAPIDAELARSLPVRFRGLPTRFAFTGEAAARHHVDVADPHAFLLARLGFDPTEHVAVHDWLSLSGQAVLEVTAGAVLVDEVGVLTAARTALEWYPDDL